MALETTLVYTEPLLRQAVFGFWRRSLGVGVPVAFVLATFCVVLLIFQGITSWIVGALGAGLAIAAAIAIAVYVVHYRNAMRKFREMGEPKAIFRADDSTFTISSAIGTSTFQWSTIKEVWQFHEFWLILFSRAQFATLPTSCLPVEMQAFILSRVQAAGGKV
jgi:hypothetical protein